MENLRPNEQRAKNAILLIWIVLGLEVVSLLIGYSKYNLFYTVASGGDISMQTKVMTDLSDQIVSISYSITSLISGILFIMWFRRAYFNLHLKTHDLRFSEGWAAGSWFVPILSLFRPYQIMKDLYGKTTELITQRSSNLYQGLSVNLLGWWWTLFLLQNVVKQITFHYIRQMDSIDNMVTATILSMYGNLIGIPLAMITVRVIQDYMKVEPMLHEVPKQDLF